MSVFLWVSIALLCYCNAWANITVDDFSKIFVSNENHYHKNNIGTYPSNFPDGFIIQGYTGAYEAGISRVQHSFDAAAKIFKLSFKDGQVSFESNMMMDGYYKAMKKKEAFPSAKMFMETIPARNVSFGAMTEEMMGNSFDKPFKFGDDVIMLSDDPFVSILNTDDLTADTKDVMMIPNVMKDLRLRKFDLLQTAHFQMGITDSTKYYGISSSGSMLGESNSRIHLFTVDNSANYLSSIGGIDYIVKNSVREFNTNHKDQIYSHDYSLGPNYAIVSMHGFRMNIGSIENFLFNTSSVLSDALYFDQSINTSLLILPLDTNHATSDPIVIDLKIPNLMLHMTNHYESDDGNILTFHTSTYPCNGFNGFSMDAVNHRNGGNLDCNAQVALLEVTVNLATKEAQYKKISPGGDFFNYNPNYNGKKYCYLYANQLPLLTPLLKYDFCKNTVKVTQEPNVIYGEQLFIPATDGSAEDDGFIVVQKGYPKLNKTIITMFDARDMSVLHEYDVGPLIAFSIHAAFFPY